jgi:hypothetical protein
LILIKVLFVEKISLMIYKKILRITTISLVPATIMYLFKKPLWGDLVPPTTAINFFFSTAISYYFLIERKNIEYTQKMSMKLGLIVPIVALGIGYPISHFLVNKYRKHIQNKFDTKNDVESIFMHWVLIIGLAPFSVLVSRMTHGPILNIFKKINKI